jgi:hypothetical protein
MTAFPAPETFFPLEISQKFETGLFVREPLPDVDGQLIIFYDPVSHVYTF